MKNKLSFVFMLMSLSIGICIGQQDTGNVIPDIFPASPEASTLGQFGEIQINTSIGMINESIPIYTIQEDGFNLPVSLSYSYNGFVVDQIPGHLGVGWNLNASGMITRQVRGRPDEDYNGYTGDQMTGANYVRPYLLNEHSEAQKKLTREAISSGLVDGEPDKFILNIGGMNATFYIDHTKNVMIKPYMPYTISIINNDISQGFNVIDDNGIEYQFTEVETSKRITPPDGENPGVPILDEVPSGWKISQITLTNNRVITFDYDDQFHLQRYYSQSYKERLSGNCEQSSTSTSIRDYEIRSKLIKTITFPKGQLLFDNEIVYLGNNPYEYNNQYQSYLKKIEVKNTQNTIVSTYDLNFNGLGNTYRTLEGITINNDASNKYSFEYNIGANANIHWAKQDFWGYLNSNPTTSLMANLDSFDIYENRVPDFENAKHLSLKKIIYPTKGYTEIEYEANTFDPETGGAVPYDCSVADTNQSVSKTASINWIEQQAGTNYTSEQISFSVEAPFTFVDLNLLVEKLSDPSGPNSDGSIYGRVRAQVFKDDGVVNSCQDINCAGLTTGGCDGVFITLGSPTHSNEGLERYNRRVQLSPGSYTLFVEAENSGIPYDLGDIIRATATVNYFEDDGAPPVRSMETAGIRVAKVTSCPNDNSSQCTITEYEYETNEGISMGRLFRKRNFTSYDFFRDYLGDNSCYSTYRVHSSSSNVPLSYYMGSHVFYDKVKEKRVYADGSSEGYVEKQYTFSIPSQSASFPFIAIDNREFKNGHIKEEAIYNDTNALVSKSSYEYEFSGIDDNALQGVDGEVLSLAVGVEGTSSGSGPTVDFEIVFYVDNAHAFRNSSDRVWLKQKTDSLYYTGATISSVTDFEYTNPRGHLKEQQTTDSDGSVISTRYSYPYSGNTQSGALLLPDYRFAVPLKTETFKDGILRSTQETIYGQWSPDILEPEYIQSTKANTPAENRVVYHNYDDQGHPLEVSLADGTRISYIWGYANNYPIARIENKAYASISSTLINNVISASNGSNESLLLDAFQDLREALPDAQVTTYTYDPLVGVTTQTDPRGYTMYYVYDDLNRLKYVKDQNGKVYSKNEYHYRGSN